MEILMKRSGWLALMMSIPFGAAIAADFDGSRALICAPVVAIDCSPGEPCSTGRPGDVGAPNFMRIDFEKKTIAGPKRTTEILTIQKSVDAGQLLMQGHELGYAWTLALHTGDGSMGVTLVNRDGVFVLFGSCTPL
jgi:hypothetical protein